MATLSLEKETINAGKDFLPLKGTDYVEFYVGNAKQAAHYYMSALVSGLLPMQDLKQGLWTGRVMW
jgi:4-hydroxyphenylpyruvate dioxygenase